MVKLQNSLVLLACLHGAAWSQDLRLTFQSNPSGAEVRVLSGRQERKLSGVTGRPVTLQKNWLTEDRIEVEFRLQGYQPWTSRVPVQELRDGGSWPAAGAKPIRLSKVGSNVVYFFLDSDPQGAKVTLSNSGKEPAYLGVTGSEMELDKDLVNRGLLQFHLEKEGYEGVDVPLMAGQITQGTRLPEKGPVRLHLTWSGWLRAWALPLFGSLGVIGLVLGWSLRRRPAAAGTQVQLGQAIPGDPVGTPSNHAEGLRRLGYQLHDELGRGGMAVVYEATRSGSETLLALKLLHREVGLDKDSLQRMRREIKILRELQHPSIVPLYDFGDVNGQYYLVMEKVDGIPLKARLDQGRLPLEEALKYIRAFLDGICYAHSKGIVHRDLKPDNAMIRKDGRLQILDFGISRSVTANTFETLDNSVLGTPAYMAPERFSGVTNQSSDQYALGLILYEMLTGVQAVPSNLDIAQTIKKQLFELPPKPSEVDPAVSPALDYLVMTMIAKKPEHRFGSLLLARDQLYKAQPEMRPEQSYETAPMNLPPV